MIQFENQFLHSFNEVFEAHYGANTDNVTFIHISILGFGSLQVFLQHFSKFTCKNSVIVVVIE
jgi:hypothetical protein